MTPAARVQAAIELLDSVIAAAKAGGAPADRLIAAYFKSRRYAGSKDRRAVRDLVYDAIRHCGEIPQSGRAAMLALAQGDAALTDLFDGSPHGPAPVRAGEPFATPGVAPAWLVAALRASGLDDGVMAAMLGRAPLDVRVNTLKAERDDIDLPEAGEKLAAPQALRFPAGTAVEQWEAYAKGLIEVQDHGSQLVGLAGAVLPGETVIDLCAGAGGKTLALAAAMGNRGRLIACDTDRRRLSQLAPRASRAGVTIVEQRELNPNREMEALTDLRGAADLVLVDAPCSGTGTWRRKPEAKWRLTPDRLAYFAALQDHVLNLAAQLVRPGGRISFITCSLLDDEGADRIAAFLARHPGWTGEAPEIPLATLHRQGVRLDPFHHGTDGFFVATLRSSC